MVFYILTSYRVLGIVYLNQLTGARHTHTYLITIPNSVSVAHRCCTFHIIISFKFLVLLPNTGNKTNLNQSCSYAPVKILLFGIKGNI